MTSKIVVNNIQSDTGVTTVTIASPVALSGGITGTGFAVGTGASISSPTTNVLTLGTNNVERIRVGAAGSIGIGTTNPLGVLAVSGGVSNPAITFQNGSTTNTASDAAVGSIVGYSRTTGGNINIGSVDIRTDTDSASSGAVRILTALNGSLAERLRVDSSGRVTMPYQPGFCAAGTAGAANQPSTGDAAMLGTLFDRTSHTGGFNTGNHYSTGTGIFTAPVAGKYYTFFNMRWETGNFVQNSYIRIYISKNNADTLFIHQINGQNEAWSNYMAMSCSGIIDLAAGDTLRPKGGLNGGTAVGWWNESSWGAWLLG